MKSHTEYLTLRTRKRRELVHLTPKHLAPARADHEHRLFYAELDGQRDERLVVKVLGV